MSFGERIIHRLDESVIKRIAAGEVIHGPINVFKELLENALDSGADRISITFKGGGTTLIEVTDNGTGISDADMELICQRHTTSKIRTFKDITEVQTFGFRGEALFSISCISDLTITTNQTDTMVGISGKYFNGNLVGELQRITATKGTTISAQNIFLGNQQRLNSLPSFRLRNRKVIFMMLKYCVALPHVAFSLYVDEKDKIHSPGNSTSEEVLQTLFSYQDTTRLDIDITKNTSATVFLGSPKKKMMKINGIFVNNRLIHNELIKRGINKVYADYTKPGVIPFFIVMLKIDSSNLDVNVHPTKKTVLISREKFIANAIINAIEVKMKELYSHRQEKAKIDLDFAEQTEEKIPELRKNSYMKTKLEIENEEPQPIIEPHFIHNDKIQPLSKRMIAERRQKLFSEIKFKPKKIEKFSDVQTLDRFLTIVKNKTKVTNVSSFADDLPIIDTLKEEIVSQESQQLSSFFVAMKLVGFIELKYCFVDVCEALYMLDIYQITKEFFRQIIIKFFGKFGKFVFDEPIDISDLFGECSIEEEFNFDRLEIYQELLHDNFNICICNGQLTTLPVLIPGYFPDLSKLPIFLLNLSKSLSGKDVNSSFPDIVNALAEFNAIHENEDINEIQTHLENDIIPEMRRAGFRVPKSLYFDGFIKQITNVKHVERLLVNY